MCLTRTADRPLVTVEMFGSHANPYSVDTCDRAGGLSFTVALALSFTNSASAAPRRT